jgi:hypothetical protein
VRGAARDGKDMRDSKIQGMNTILRAHGREARPISLCDFIFKIEALDGNASVGVLCDAREGSE